MDEKTEALIDETIDLEPILDQPTATLWGALWQILDDMGKDGHACCDAAKFQGLDALRVAAGKPRVFEHKYDF